MPPTTSQLDLTTLAAVKSWLQIATGVTTDDQIIQDCITALGAYILRITGRGPEDGTLPTASPFVSPQPYDEWYDGTGTNRMPIRNWPITAVSFVNINGTAIPQSTSPQVSGWVVDGDKRFITLRGGFSPAVATFQNYGNQRGRGCGAVFPPDVQNVEVSYTAGFAAVPFDLEMAARKIVSLNYKKRGWIGQVSQAMASGAGTVTYGMWEMDKDAMRTIDYYQRRAA